MLTDDEILKLADEVLGAPTPVPVLDSRDAFDMRVSNDKEIIDFARTIEAALQPSQNELPPQVGDIVAFMVRAHPIMGVPYEVIGRVERDSRGLHAGNRYLPLDGVRVVERTRAAAEAAKVMRLVCEHSKGGIRA